MTTSNEKLIAVMIHTIDMGHKFSEVVVYKEYTEHEFLIMGREKFTNKVAESAQRFWNSLASKRAKGKK